MSKNILVLAYAISPFRGSEYSVAWDYVVHMSQNNKLTIIYGMSGDNMGDLSELQIYLRSNKIPNTTFIPIKPNKVTNILNLLNKKGILVYTYYLAYKLWQKSAYKKAKEIVQKERFDLIHYLGPIGYREPGYLWKLHLPYLWGPIGGVDNACFKLFPSLTLNSKCKLLFRNIINNIQLRYKIRVSKALKRTDLLLSSTTKTQMKLIRIKKINSIYIPENCINTEIQLNKTKFIGQNKLRMISIGSLNGGKGIIILLKSLVLVRNREFILDIIGDGPERLRLQKFVEDNDLSNNVLFHGKLPREKAVQYFTNSHLNIITSLCEGNPTTIWEAMSHGVPTLSIDHYGMHDTITEQSGFKIPIYSYNQIIEDIAKTIDYCLLNPEILIIKADNTIKEAMKYRWPERTLFFEKCYDNTISNFNRRLNNEKNIKYNYK